MSERTAATDDPLDPVHESPLEVETHALASVVYAERDDGSILLLRRTEGSALAGQYFLPGGIVDPGEEPYEAARRELREEAGIEIGPLQLVGCYLSPLYGRSFLMLSFRGSIVGSADVTISAEHDGVQWVDPAEFRSVFDGAAIEALADGNDNVDRLLRNITADLDRYLTLVNHEPSPTGAPDHE